MTTPTLRANHPKLARVLHDVAQAEVNTADCALKLTQLVDALRPFNADNSDLANARFLALCEALESSNTVAGDALNTALYNHIVNLFAQRRQVSFFSDSGILPDTGFFSECWRRLVARVLPTISDANNVLDCINHIFHKRDDYVWINSIDAALKLRFWQALQVGAEGEQAGVSPWQESKLQMLDATDHLATRIGATGLDPELMRLYSRLAERDSPFLALALSTHQAAQRYRASLDGSTADAATEPQTAVLIAQCREAIVRIRSRAASHGTSLSVTYLLVRLEQSLHRLELLLSMLYCGQALPEDAQNTGVSNELVVASPLSLPTLWIEFLNDAIAGEARRRGVRSLVARTIGLLALRVTHNASRTGEHYIATSRDEYFAMWRSAMGAGLIVGFMALAKISVAKIALPPLGYALAYSLDYALGFMLIHMLHFTVATKQPAMTAATIAAAISEIRGRLRELESLSTVIVDVLRTQIAAIFGNVLVALPTAMLIAFVSAQITGQPLVSAEKAHALLQSISPLKSLALFYAAIAGVCLFLAGLISGYYDNLAAYERIRERVERAAWVKALLGEARQRRFAVYLDNNLGALAGNFFFGFMLGTMPTLGYLTGLPLDVCHVTFSAAYFGFSMVALNFSVDPLIAAHAFIGIACVGLVNLTVSFSLALWVALRARGVAFGFDQIGTLVTILWGKFRQDWRQFVWLKKP
jgi:site-specific recombinase